MDVKRAVPNVIVDIRYAGKDNFVGEPIAGYEKNLCLLLPETSKAIAGIANELSQRGLALVFHDCYRPKRAVDDFLAWAKDPQDQRRKEEHYPRVAKENLFREGYIARRSGHSRGSTVDVTLASKNGKGQWVPLDMGTPYDFLDPASALDAPGISAEARKNRKLLQDIFARHGFRGYSKEWWHFTLEKEPCPKVTFDRPVR